MAFSPVPGDKHYSRRDPNCDSGTDIAINGDGYFIVQPPLGFTGNIPIFGGVDSYTRRGDFEQNAQGYLVNGAGYYLSGFQSIPRPAIRPAPLPLRCNSRIIFYRPMQRPNHVWGKPSDRPRCRCTSRGTYFRTSQSFGFHAMIRQSGERARSLDQRFDLCERIDRRRIGDRFTANGTAANIQFRWAKTDSVAAGGADTWNLFYDELSCNRHGLHG